MGHIVGFVKGAGQFVNHLWNSNPAHNAQMIMGWIVNHSEGFAVVGIVGVLLWLFGLNVGKKMLQWSLALFALAAILSGAL